MSKPYKAKLGGMDLVLSILGFIGMAIALWLVITVGHGEKSSVVLIIVAIICYIRISYTYRKDKNE